MDTDSPLNGLLGRLVIGFQDLEASIDDLMVLMAVQMVDADSEAIEILISELEYESRVRTADVLFARFIDVRAIDGAAESKRAFHKLMDRCKNLGKVRNVFAHSSYAHLVNDVGTPIALIQKNSRLKDGKGLRVVQEEDLTQASFEPHFDELRAVMEAINGVRQQIIKWQYPD